MGQARGGTAAFFAMLLLLLGFAGLGLFALNAAPGLWPSSEAPLGAPPAEGGMYHRVYRWEYGNRNWEIRLDVPASTYDHYHRLDRPSRIVVAEGGPQWRYAYEDFVTDPGDDASLETIAKELQRLGHQRGWSDDRILSFTLAFVQSMPYTSDEVTAGFDEYPRYPLETLVDNGGDCEDTSILYASLILAMGYGAALVSPPGHMAVGVLADEEIELDGYEHDGNWYLYAETTGDGYGIGEMPAAYRNERADLYPLS